MRRLFSLWKVLEQHCVFTQLYTLPSCFSSPDLCYHVPGRNLIKWHRVPTISSSLSISHLCQTLIVCLAGLDCLSSHQWGHTFGLPSLFLPQHLPCHLFCCRIGQRTGRSDSISNILRLMYWTEPPPRAIALSAVKRGQGFTAETSGLLVLQLPALRSAFALTSLNLNLLGGLSCTIHC